jgi:protein-L-isoaspartate(D-aspartate) O-methyltransferase
MRGLILFLILSSDVAYTMNSLNRSEVRKIMVETQLRNQGITDAAVLAAMEKVPRHEFVPASHQEHAYGNFPLPIGKGQTISQPFIVAYMTQKLQLKKSDRVLEIGTGSGYQTAILSELASHVYSIEIIPELAEVAKLVLHKLGYKNIEIKTGDGYEGWPDHAPYDAIIVTAAPEHIPEPLLKQLKLGGRMVIPVGLEKQQMITITKTKNGLLKEKTADVRFVPMTGTAQEK